MMPGTRLLAFVSRWFEPAVVATVFEPLVADWQRQWSDATPAQRMWVNTKGRVALAATAAIMSPRLLVTPMSFRAHSLAPAGAFWLFTSCLLTLPFLREELPLRLIWLLLPGSLTLMLPFAVLPAIDAMRSEAAVPTPADRRAALVLVAVAILGVVIGQGWLTPAANQRWRNETMTELRGRPSVASRGVREVTTSELIAGDVAITPAISGVRRARELSLRLSLALLPAVLAWLRWQALRRPRTRAWPVVRSLLVAIVAAVTCISLMGAARSLEFLFFAPGLGPLLALGLFAFTARTGIWLRQRTA